MAVGRRHRWLTSIPLLGITDLVNAFILTRFAPWLRMTWLVDLIYVAQGRPLVARIYQEAVVQLWWPGTAPSSTTDQRNWVEPLLICQEYLLV